MGIQEISGLPVFATKGRLIPSQAAAHSSTNSFLFSPAVFNSFRKIMSHLNVKKVSPYCRYGAVQKCVCKRGCGGSRPTWSSSYRNAGFIVMNVTGVAWGLKNRCVCKRIFWTAPICFNITCFGFVGNLAEILSRLLWWSNSTQGKHICNRNFSAFFWTFQDQEWCGCDPFDTWTRYALSVSLDFGKDVVPSHVNIEDFRSHQFSSLFVSSDFAHVSWLLLNRHSNLYTLFRRVIGPKIVTYRHWFCLTQKSTKMYLRLFIQYLFSRCLLWKKSEPDIRALENHVISEVNRYEGGW